MTAAVAVRPARADEADAVAALAAVTFPLACPPSSTPADHAAFIAANLTLAHFAAHLADPARDVLVADDGDALLGYTLLVAGEPYAPEVAAVVPLRPTVELSKCYVLPGQHGRGVADALMAASLDAARARGAAGVWLGVNGENARAQGFYRRSGFTQVGTRTFQVGAERHHDLVLHRAV
ncbi:GNAT family N-acetyltransferase [Cellulomonas triticagri]|uniref:GNAT family N-acetyltransferase n=1 Tax=Cellulomonas triticagri TaxID=2483352 RepID=A0A3M2JLL9_9CELL|nr:GNAT family N-acetyltransferase [Cellulomonas triticagri]RMI13136.1 GNAT family N-acetyltransferase [Cellulomonas triticagri]